MHARRTLAALVCVLVAACGPEPRPEYRPYATPIELDAAPGSPLTGPTAGPLPSDDPDAALRLHVGVLGLADADTTSTSPLDAKVVLVVARPDATPLRPTTSGDQGLRLAAGDERDALASAIELGELGRVDLLAEATAAVPLGAMVLLTLGDPDDPRTALTFAVWREDAPRLAVLARRPSLPTDPLGAADDALDAMRDDAPRKPRPTRAPSPSEWPLQVAVLSPTVLPTGGRCSIVVPRPQPGWPNASLVVQLELTAAPRRGDEERADHEAALQLCRDLCARAVEHVATRSRVPATGLSGALSALSSPARRGPALVYLASSTGARLAEDVALAGDSLLVSDVAHDVLAEPVTDAELGFRLERSALLRLADRAENGEMPPAQDALLTLGAGQLARDPAVLTELVAQAVDLADLRALLVDENLAFLEDAEPSARVRAYDWLDARDLAPAGYDPLGPRDERRAALDAWLEQEDAASTATSDDAARPATSPADAGTPTTTTPATPSPAPTDTNPAAPATDTARAARVPWTAEACA
ncbi:MAG: hypothetical protein H6825_06745 [Planctomycetes bacterium]|nr:hypothetical protein [Planctomycetota bacterium]